MSDHLHDATPVAQKSIILNPSSNEGFLEKIQLGLDHLKVGKLEDYVLVHTDTIAENQALVVMEDYTVHAISFDGTIDE